MNKAKQTSNEQLGATITKVEPKHNFIILYDSVYKNNDLTAIELQLLIKLLASAPTFKPTAEKLAQILKHDKRAINKASKGLQQKGYLKIKKFGKNSEWIITQEPIIHDLKEITKESLLNALFNNQITTYHLDKLHKLKYIDDRLYIETANEYAKEVIRIAHINVYGDDE